MCEGGAEFVCHMSVGACRGQEMVLHSLELSYG